MLNVIFGNDNAERVLQYLLAKEDGYLSEISKYYNTAPSIMKKQIDKFVAGNVIVGKNIGRTRVFVLNRRYPFIKEDDHREAIAEEIAQHEADEQKTKKGAGLKIKVKLT